MHSFTPVPALIGGALIGLAASLFLLTHGKVAGISGLYAGLLRRGTSDRSTPLAFIAGLLLAGAAMRTLFPGLFEASYGGSLTVALAAGLLVGFGTQLGNGCTSGHGVCGISRLSPRSLVATGTFMATGFLTVLLTQHVFGGGR